MSEDPSIRDGQNQTSAGDTGSAARACWVGLLFFVCAVALARLIAHGIVATTSQEVFSDEIGGLRESQAISHLPNIASKSGAVVLVFGSSMTELGFSPDQFDSSLHEMNPRLDVTSYNFGFGGLNPSIQLLLARKIRSALEHEKKTLALSLLELAPLQTTSARFNNDDKWGVTAFRESELLSVSKLIPFAASYPGEALRIFQFDLLGLPPVVITNLVTRKVFDPPWPKYWSVPPLDETEKRRLELQTLLKKRLGDPIPEWLDQFRGESRDRFPETESLLQGYRMTPAQMERNKQWRIDCCDVLELHFEERFVRDFIATVNELGKTSSRTVVFLTPRNSTWIQPSQSGLRRQAELIARIEKETGVEVVDLSLSPEFVADDFRDPTHLNATTGTAKLSKVLAERIRPFLENRPAVSP